MAKFPGLMTRKRSRMWYYRATVPRGLRDLYGKSQIWVSLGTEDRAEAERAWYEVSAKWRDEFERKQFELDNPGVRVRQRAPTRQERLRRTRREALQSGELNPLTRSAATELARRWYRQELAARWAGTPEYLDEAIDDARSMLAQLSDPDDGGTLAATQEIANALLTEHRYAGSVGDPEHDHLTELLRLAMLELERLHLQTLETGEDRVIRDHLFGTAAPFEPERKSGTVRPGSGTNIKDALEQFAQEAAASRSSSDQVQASKVSRWHEVIRSHFGDTFQVDGMKARDIEAFLSFTTRLPTHLRKKYPKLSIADAIAAAEREGQTPISERTRADYERELRRFVRWCRRHELMTGDPFELVEPTRSKDGRRKHRTAYEIEDLRALFNAPLYTGCRNDEYGFNRPGPNRPRRGRFWLPLLGLFTGARAGELCQLRVQDVRATEAGTPYLSIRNDEEWMSVKTRNAIRDVPVHPELVKLGFLEYVGQCRQSGDDPLFPEMLIEGKAPSYRFSKLYRTYRRAVGVDGDNVDFHSFRHTARQALRRADLFREAGHRADEKIDDAFGWSKGKGMSSHYGQGWAVDELAKLVAVIEYPGLDLSHLYPRASGAHREP